MKTTFRSFLAALAFAGLAAHAQFFGPDTRLTTLSGISYQPDIAVAGANVYIVWSENAQVFFMRSTNGGGSFTIPVNVSANASDQLAIISVSADGTQVHIFSTDDVSTGSVWYRRSIDSGVNFLPAVQIVNTPGYSKPTGTIVDSNGCVHLGHYDSITNGIQVAYGSAYHRISCDGGASWSVDTEVSLIDGEIDTEQPRFTEINKILYMLVRRSGNGLPQPGWVPFDQYLYRGTIPASAPVVTNGGANPIAWQRPPQKVSMGLPEELNNTYGGNIITGANSVMHLAFWGEKSGNNLLYRRGFPNGKGFGPITDISGFGSDHLEWQGYTVDKTGFGMGEDPSQRLHMIFSDNTQLVNTFQVGHLWYRCSPDQGVTWQTKTPASTSAKAGLVRAAYSPLINKMHIVWQDYSVDNNGSELYYKFFVPGPCVDPLADTDGDGMPNGVEMLEGRNLNALDNDVFGVPRLFVMQQYRDFLSREGDEAGIQGWVNFINAGTYDRLQVINAFFNSTEFNGVVAPVARLYFATFLRVPDYAGLIFNVGLVKAGSITLIGLADFFTQSPEFMATYGSLNNTQFVTLLYNNVLNRAPDQAGLNGWLNLMNQGYTRGQVLVGFSESPEYQQSQFNQVYVTMMYVGMLRRSPEPNGYNGWLTYLQQPGNSPLSMINGFYLSTEYKARFLP